MTSTDTATSVVIVDDHDVIHAGIEAWLAGADPPVVIAATFLDVDECVAAFARGTHQPDVVLFDLQYGTGKPNFAALQMLCGQGRRVIVFSHLSADEVILSSLDAGAVSYLVKSEGRSHLIDAIRAARSDVPYVAPYMAKALANGQAEGRPGLSEREREVLLAWFQTESKELVAARLFIEPSTVRTHLQRVRTKYAAVGRPAPTKAALVANAIRDGVISVEEL